MAEVSYNPPEDLPDASLLMIAAERLVAIPQAAEREEAILTLFKLIDGVLGAPEEVKKRRVKKTNETFNRKVGRFAAGIDFLRAAGFVEGDDPDAEGDAGRNALLSMPIAYLLRITDAHHTLAQAAQKVGIQPPPLPGGGFNPYCSNQQSADSTRTAKAPNSWKGEADRLRDEVKKRQREMREKVDSAPPIDMQPSAFWLSAGRRLEEVVRETSEPATEERTADNALLATQVAAARAAMNGANSKFESADKKRLAELSHKRVHENCILRVICPDKSVLQVHFRAAERGEQVMSLLAPLLAPNVVQAGWYIYQSPPLKKLAPRETLAQAGFTPGANVYLGFEGGARPSPPYFAPNIAAQLGPPPAEASRGVNAAAGPTFCGEAMGWGVGQKLGGPAPPVAAAAPAAAAPAASDGGPVPMEQ